jgi:hypothetical protein
MGDLAQAKKALGVCSERRKDQWVWVLDGTEDIQGIRAGGLNILNTLTDKAEAS